MYNCYTIGKAGLSMINRIQMQRCIPWHPSIEYRTCVVRQSNCLHMCMWRIVTFYDHRSMLMKCYGTVDSTDPIPNPYKEYNLVNSKGKIKSHPNR